MGKGMGVRPGRLIKLGSSWHVDESQGKPSFNEADHPEATPVRPPASDAERLAEGPTCWRKKEPWCVGRSVHLVASLCHQRV